MWLLFGAEARAASGPIRTAAPEDSISESISSNRDLRREELYLWRYARHSDAPFSCAGYHQHQQDFTCLFLAYSCLLISPILGVHQAIIYSNG